MKTRPIIFNGEMVRAILDGRKTQTRRVIKPQPVLGKPWKDWVIDPERMDLPTAYCPYGIRGDRLWVRETWFPMQDIKACTAAGEPIDIVYKADWDADGISRDEARDVGIDRWRPSIFMPRWASRITLEITRERAEQVQDIKDNDAFNEGWPRHLEMFPTINAASKAQLCLQQVWNSIYAKQGLGWYMNPWVWAIEFQSI